MYRNINKLVFIFVLLMAASLINSCSYTREITYNSIDQKDCTYSEILSSMNGAPEVHVDSLTAIESNNLITVSMNVRTYCNAIFDFKIEKNEDRINLYLHNTNRKIDNCICTRELTVSFNKVKPGFYSIVLTNYSGTQLLGLLGFNIK